jgi:gluconokinase
MIIVVMGVTGSGKTTVGQMLAARLGYLFADADDFHSAANKEKMHKGVPLTDADRIPWLAAMHELIAQRLRARKGHFADEHILAGQFADLEEPSDAVVVDISASPEAIVSEICLRLELDRKN